MSEILEKLTKKSLKIMKKWGNVMKNNYDRYSS